MNKKSLTLYKVGYIIPYGDVYYACNNLQELEDMIDRFRDYETIEVLGIVNTIEQTDEEN